MLSWIIGQFGSRVVYPAAEKYLGRDIRTRVNKTRVHYHLPFAERKRRQQRLLFETVKWASLEVPYYRDLFTTRSFTPEKILQDVRYLQELPFLTKKEILEQGDRMLATSLVGQWATKNKTGGSTGGSVFIWYDRAAADESAAMTRFARTLCGKTPHKKELHFASKFLEEPCREDKIVGRVKDIAMNRHNVYFSDLSDASLEEIWQEIRRYKPYLLHSHPSTAYALALFIEKRGLQNKAFKVFESSGELLDAKKREKIESAMKCRVYDRYGLAEFGVVAYQNRDHTAEMRLFDDFIYPEIDAGEIVFTGLKNRYMPLIRYRTGDMGQMVERDDGFYLTDMYGRVHDLLVIGEKTIPTHHIQDVLDRIGGILEFQIAQRGSRFALKIVAQDPAGTDRIRHEICRYFGTDLDVEFIPLEQLTYVGHRQKFRYLISEPQQQTPLESSP